MLAFAWGRNAAKRSAQASTTGALRGLAAAAGEDAGALAVRPQHRFDEAALDAYLRRELPWIGDRPISIRQFTHGQSNPTFRLRLEEDRRTMVLRKQPPGKLLRGAHRVDREHRAMAALSAAGSDVPVPEPYLLCEDADVIGTPFFVYDFVEGEIFTDPRMPDAAPEQRRAVYSDMARVMAALHATDYEAIGLGDFGKVGGFFERQIKVWSSQYQASTDAGAPPSDAMAHLSAWLPDRLSRVAASDWTCLTHGDLRLDNMVVDPGTGSVRAVLDWELATLGHPLADAAYNCLPYYLPPSSSSVTGFGDPLAPGLPAEADYVAAYLSALRGRLQADGRAVSGFAEEGAGGLPRDWQFHVAFSLFRVSAILQGVLARARQGNASSAQAEQVGALAGTMAELGAACAARFDSEHGIAAAAAGAGTPPRRAPAGRDVAAAEPGLADDPALGSLEQGPATWLPRLSHDEPPLAAQLRMSPRSRELWGDLHEFMTREVLPVEQEVLDHQYTSPQRWEQEHPSLAPLKAQARQRGLWNLFLPDPHHGAGLSNLEYAPLAELMGQSLIAPALFNCQAPDTGNAEVLHMYGTEEQQRQWLQPLLDDEIRSCFGMTEPGVASSDATNMRATVERDGGELVLRGRKWWTSGACDPRCRLMIFMGADVDQLRAGAPKHQRHSMVLVPMEQVTVERAIRVYGYEDAPHGHAEVTLDNVRVPVGNLLVGPGKGFEIAQGRLGPGRVHHCMRLIGMAERSILHMAHRADGRTAFGRPLSEQGSVRSRLARARIAVEQARLLVLGAAEAMDRFDRRASRKHIAMIKVAVPEAVAAVVDSAIQVHGGVGVAQDTPLAHMWASARALRLADGPDEVHEQTVGRMELKEHGLDA